ncbi:hypothetical protein C8R43DRAFT_958573 [Mycena crocata]|nr:hypothetical protein C8R43DRAFT_958573 [Mycena crocata]
MLVVSTREMNSFWGFPETIWDLRWPETYCFWEPPETLSDSGPPVSILSFLGGRMCCASQFLRKAPSLAHANAGQFQTRQDTKHRWARHDLDGTRACRRMEGTRLDGGRRNTLGTVCMKRIRVDGWMDEGRAGAGVWNDKPFAGHVSRTGCHESRWLAPWVLFAVGITVDVVGLRSGLSDSKGRLPGESTTGSSSSSTASRGLRRGTAGGRVAVFRVDYLPGSHWCGSFYREEGRHEEPFSFEVVGLRRVVVGARVSGTMSRLPGSLPWGSLAYAVDRKGSLLPCFMMFVCKSLKLVMVVGGRPENAAEAIGHEGHWHRPRGRWHLAAVGRKARRGRPQARIEWSVTGEHEARIAHTFQSIDRTREKKRKGKKQEEKRKAGGGSGEKAGVLSQTSLGDAWLVGKTAHPQNPDPVCSESATVLQTATTTIVLETVTIPAAPMPRSWALRYAQYYLSL